MKAAIVAPVRESQTMAISEIIIGEPFVGRPGRHGSARHARAHGRRSGGLAVVAPGRCLRRIATEF
jgi:hypothetical protein